MNSYDLNIMLGFAIVGILIKLFFGTNISTDGSNGPASSVLWGYGVVVLALFTTLIMTFSDLNNLPNTDYISFIKSLFQTGWSLPILVTLLILVWIISLNASFFKSINEGKVADEYYQISQMNTVLIVLQLIVIFMAIRPTSGPTLGPTLGPTTGNTNLTYIIYILTLLNVILIGMMNITLTYFSTDG
jgi:hypothetical protein